MPRGQVKDENEIRLRVDRRTYALLQYAATIEGKTVPEKASEIFAANVAKAISLTATAQKTAE